MSLDNDPFQTFYEGWWIRHDEHLQDLIRLIDTGPEEDEESCQQLIGAAMSHYKEYFDAKARLAHENVYLALGAPWHNWFELTHGWMGDIRPRVAFRLLSNNGIDLTDEQSQRINALAAEIKQEEVDITEELQRVQYSMDAALAIEIARHFQRPRNGAVYNTRSAVDRYSASLEVIVEYADLLRKKTGMLLVQILRPAQAVKFLAAVIRMHSFVHRTPPP